MSPRRGTSLLEVVIASGVVLLLLAVLGSLLSSSATQARYDQSAADAGNAARKALRVLGAELTNSGGDLVGDYVTPNKADGTATSGPLRELTFRARRSLGPDGGEWAEEVTYRLKASPGEDPTRPGDDDGDGLVDEQLLVRIQGGREVVVEARVLDFQVERAPGEDLIQLTLTVGRAADPRPVVRTVRTAIRLRNRARTPASS